MRLSISPSRQQGSILAITLILCVLIGLMLAGYLTLVGGQNRFTQRSQVWNNIVPTCESGIEEALAHINYSGTTSNFAINGWSLVNNVYTKHRETDDGYYNVTISKDTQPVITAQGFLRAPLQTNYITRTVRVKTKINVRFPQAILAKGAISLGGNAVVDSFDSTNALYNTLGQYDPLKRSARATVATNSKLPGQFSVGNAVIYGRTATGPGGNLTINNGVVGDILWDTNPLNKGKVEPGYYTDDLNVYIPDVKLPSDFGAVFTPSAGTVNGTNYTYVISDGDWQLSTLNLSSSDKVIITGKARLYVTGSTSLSGQASIQIALGASLEYYAGGSVSLGGGGLVNSPGSAAKFALYGLPTCTSIDYSGNSQFVGTINAPQADVKLTGTSDAIGAIVGKSLTLNGGMGLHYDEALRGDPREGRFLVASWEEI